MFNDKYLFHSATKHLAVAKPEDMSIIEKLQRRIEACVVRQTFSYFLHEPLKEPSVELPRPRPTRTSS